MVAMPLGPEFSLKIKADTQELSKFDKKIERIAKQVRFAQALAVTRTAGKLKLEQQNLMKKVFHRPLPYTLESLYVKPANRKDDVPEAFLYFRTFTTGGVPAGKYLQAQIFGGPRVRKATEKKLQRGFFNGWQRIALSGTFINPRKSERDQYGNISGGRLNKIYADLEKGKSKSSNFRERFFIMKTNKYAAIWVRERQGTNVILTKSDKIKELKRTRYRGQPSTIKPILYLNRNSPNYRQRYPFYEFSEQYWDKNIDREFGIALSEAYATAKW